MTQPPRRVQLMGPVRAWRDGAEVGLRGVSARTVLAQLALARGSAVTMSTLVDALWADDPPSNAAGNIQSVVSRLRRDLGADAIESTPGGYRLSDTVQTDFAELRAALEAVDCMDPPVAVATLDRHAAAWQGAPLDDVASTVAHQPDRAMLHELQLHARDRSVALAMDAGLVDEAIPAAGRQAEAAPLRERSQILFADALARSGRAAEALRVIARYRAHLAEETGLEVSSAVMDLERAVLDGERQEQRATDGVGRRQGVPVRWLPPGTPFVGRQAELVELATLADTHRLVTVVGPGGIGKSRLLMEHHRRAPAAGTVVVALAPVEPGSDIDLAVAAALGIEPTVSDVFDTIVERLRMAPTTVILDNCEHVVDGASRLVGELLREVEGVRILATSRHSLGLAEERLVRVGPLRTGPSSPSTMLLADRLERVAVEPPDDPSGAGMVDEVGALLGGIPLALELAAPRAHVLGLDGLRAELSAARSSGSPDDSLMAETVTRSLALLGSDARRLFGEVCVFPDRFGLDAVEAVTTVERVVPALAALVDASLVSVAGASAQRFLVLEPVRQVGAAEVPDAVVDAYLRMQESVAARVHELWCSGRPADAHRIVADHRSDLGVAIGRLLRRGRTDVADRIASHLAIPLAMRPDIELVTSIRRYAADTPQGWGAQATLAWTVGRPRQAIELAGRALDALSEDDPLVPSIRLGVGPAYSFVGDLDGMVHNGLGLASHPAATPTARVYGICFAALGWLYRGGIDEAVGLLAEHDATLQASDAGGFVSFVRAEIAGASGGEDVLTWLDRAADGAAGAGSFMMARMVDVARLAVLSRSGELGAAARLARGVVEGLLGAGLSAQAWISLRHVARLLAEAGELELAASILASAAASPDAPALLGDAVSEEAVLGDRIRAGSGRRRTARPDPSPMSLGELWPGVAAGLDRMG